MLKSQNPPIRLTAVSRIFPGQLILGGKPITTRPPPPQTPQIPKFKTRLPPGGPLSLTLVIKTLNIVRLQLEPNHLSSPKGEQLVMEI